VLKRPVAGFLLGRAAGYSEEPGAVQGCLLAASATLWPNSDRRTRPTLEYCPVGAVPRIRHTGLLLPYPGVANAESLRITAITLTGLGHRLEGDVRRSGSCGRLPCRGPIPVAVKPAKRTIGLAGPARRGAEGIGSPGSSCPSRDDVAWWIQRPRHCQQRPSLPSFPVPGGPRRGADHDSLSPLLASVLKQFGKAEGSYQVFSHP